MSTCMPRAHVHLGQHAHLPLLEDIAELQSIVIKGNPGRSHLPLLKVIAELQSIVIKGNPGRSHLPLLKVLGT